jgi:putative ABC transport system permease protein
MRKSRYILPSLALIIGVSMITSLAMVSIEVEDRVAEGLRAFGPNLIVVPQSDDINLNIGTINLGTLSDSEYITEYDAMMIRDLPLEVFGDKVKGILGKNALLYSNVEVDGKEDATFVGTWFEELENINLWWEIIGSYPSNNNSVVIGIQAAKVLDKNTGDSILLEYSDSMIINNTKVPIIKSKEFNITGIVTTGGDDDYRIFGELDMVQEFTNKEGIINIMHLSALCNGCPLEDIAQVIEENIAGVQVKTVKQVAMAEMDTLDLVKNLVGLISFISLGASVLAVMTTLSLSVVERRKEIGLMKAVGAHNLNITSIFLGEGLIISLFSGLIGFALGILISQLIGQYVFSSSIGIRYDLILLSLATSIGIVIISSILPIRKAMKVEPVVVLRGE